MARAAPSTGSPTSRYLPWVLRARDMLGLQLDPYPALSGWLERQLARPAVAAEAEVVAAL